MEWLLYYKKIYSNAFNDCKPGIAVTILKVYSFFCFTLISISLYAFLYRAFTGFKF